MTKLLAVALVLLFAQALSAGRQRPPDVPAPKPVTLSTPAARTLANGLKVVVIERHSLPLVSLRVMVRAGAEADPPDLPGTAQMVASLLDEGTTQRTAQQLAQAIDQVGGTVQTGAEWDGSFAALSVLADHTELAFDLLSDMIVRPAFAPTEVERQRKQSLSALEVLHDDPAYLADTAFDRLVFLGTRYSHPADGTAEAVRRMRRQDLVSFHDQYYTPSNCILAVAGDISADGAFSYAKKFFGDWKAVARPLVTSPPPVTPTVGQREVVVIDKPSAVQTEIRVGNLAIPRDSPDYEALTVANQILGGPATNRLFKALRSQHGLTYGASSDLLCYQTAGAWVAKTFTRTPETIKTLQLVLDQMKHLRDHSISDSELDLTQDYLTGHMALDFETGEQVAARTLELMTYNLPLDYWNRFPEAIGKVSDQEVAAATRRYLDPDHAVIVLVGNAAEFQKDLKKFGAVRMIPVGSVDFASNSLERSAGK